MGCSAQGYLRLALALGLVERFLDAHAARRRGGEGLAGSAWHCVNVDKRIEGSLRCFVSGWSGLPVFEQMCGVPLFALAPICEPEAEAEFAPAAEGHAWRLSRAACLAPGQ